MSSGSMLVQQNEVQQQQQHQNHFATLVPPAAVSGTRVCVTGATGYVAGHIVKQLLERGYIVHATCRDPRNRKAVGHLLSLPYAQERLRLFPADLTVPGSFMHAIAGCRYVIHTASPYALECPAGQEEELLIKPAVQGTENVLASVNATPTVERVVVTSSTAAVFTDGTERGRDHVFTENDWNLIATSSRFPYFYSKKMAELRAYEMCKEAGGRWKLCTINPGAIWGPPLSNRVDGESVRQLLHLMSGVMWPYAANIGMGMVDVRDVARAHIAAMENSAASGRYLINSQCCYLLAEASKQLRKQYPQQWIPPLLGPTWGVLLFGPFMGLPQDLAKAMLDKAPKIDAGKAAKDLGMTPESYITPQQCVADMAQVMMAKHMVPSFSMPVMPLVTLCGLLVLAVVALAVLLLLRLMGVIAL